MGYEGFSGVLSFTMYGVLLMALSLVFAVIAFFLILITAKHSKTKAMVTFDILSVLSACASAVMIHFASSACAGQTAANFGSFPLYNISAQVNWGFYVALVLLLVATVMNGMVAKAPAKSDEELENERLERKAAKEAAEHEKELQNEIARREEEARAKQEQAEKVAKAKAELAAREQKKKK